MALTANDSIISGNTISDNVFGISLGGTNNTVMDNTIVNGHGLEINGPGSNEITYNVCQNGGTGILFHNTHNNVFTNNIISNNSYGMYIDTASNNQIINNNFIFNTTQAWMGWSTGNIFSDTAPLGGNYWSDWISPDNDADGFVDQPYIFWWQGQDDLPWTAPVSSGWDNQPPLAEAGGPYIVQEGGSVVLDGSASSDPDGDTLSFEWDLDGDNIFEITGKTPVFDTAGREGAEWLVVLRVSDTAGWGVSDTAIVRLMTPWDALNITKAKLSEYIDESRKFDQAVKKIEQALNLDYWIDINHLNYENGYLVFNMTRKAVKKLMGVKGGKKNKVAEEALVCAEESIESLTNAGRSLAEILISDTEAIPVSDSEYLAAVEQELTSAYAQLAEGDLKVSAGKFDWAIQHYRQAWEHAYEAYLLAESAPEPPPPPGGGGGV